MAETQTDAPAQGMPVFYKNPVPLTKEAHAGKSLSTDISFEFAAKTNVVPISASEFGLACRRYPIVFSVTDDPAPLALMGVNSGENLFVDGDGQWSKGDYVPAYVRRYPFVFTETPDKSRLVLCIDEESPRVLDDESNPFFKDGEPSEVTKQALDYCQTFQGDHATALAFAKALQEEGLLTSRQAELKVGDKTSRLSGFQLIDREKLRELSDEKIADWFKKGWLDLATCHFVSMNAWADLAQRGAPGTADTS